MPPDHRTGTGITEGSRRRGGRRALLWALAGAAAFVGVWASVAPASFHSDFVFGRQWIALDGPYNEHLIRDVGGLNLALAIVTAAAALRPDPRAVRVVAIATLAYSVPHLGYHATALEPFSTVDVVSQLVALSAQVVVPVLLLGLTSRRRDPDATRDSVMVRP